MKQYSGVDDPQLILDARESLKARYPELTENDLDNLSGNEAVRIFNVGQGQPNAVSDGD